MLAPLLVTEDPYAAASVFSQAGWKLEYETARADGSRGRASRWPWRGWCWSPRRPVRSTVCRADWAWSCSCTFRRGDLSGLFLLHRATGVAVTDLRRVPSGERGFSAEIAGYRFLILGGDPDPDLALIATDPRIAVLADGLRQRDGMDSLTDTGLRLAESSGESVRRLRRALSAGLDRQSAPRWATSWPRWWSPRRFWPGSSGSTSTGPSRPGSAVRPGEGGSAGHSTVLVNNRFGVVVGCGTQRTQATAPLCLSPGARKESDERHRRPSRDRWYREAPRSQRDQLRRAVLSRPGRSGCGRGPGCAAFFRRPKVERHGRPTAATRPTSTG